MTAFTMDGIAYKVRIPRRGIRRSAQVLDGQNAGRAQSGNMVRDVIGTYYNYSMDIDTNGTDPAEYDKLFEALSAPVDSHAMVFPYGQTTIAFDAYVTSVEDTLDTISGSANEWGGLTVKFIAMKPQRSP